MILREKNSGRNGGFTVIELLIVITIMTMLLSVIMLNVSSGRADRNLDIARNELVTNIRKAQSYTLSSRVVAAGQSGQVYIIKIDSLNPDRYFLQAIYSVNSNPTLVNMETIQLPPNVVFSNTTPIIINRNVVPLSQSYPCGLIAYKTPFSKLFLNGGCNVTSPTPFQSGDDYLNILNHVVNTPGYSASTDSSAVIQLTDKSGTKTRKILVKGISGLVCPTTDGINCSN